MTNNESYHKQSIPKQVRNFVNRDMRSFLPLFRSSILTGIFVVIPIFLSLWIGWYLYSTLTEWAVLWAEQSPRFSQYFSPFWMKQALRLLSLILILIVLFATGLLTKIALGRRLIRLAQKLMMKVPIINFIYSTCRQIGDAIWSSKGGNMFHQVVLFEYPRKGSWAIGFLTNKNEGDEFEVIRKLKRPMVSVFMPTTPNPTSGFLMFLPQDECIFLDMSVSDAMKLIVSCGAVLPGSPSGEQDNE